MQVALANNETWPVVGVKCWRVHGTVVNVLDSLPYLGQEMGVIETAMPLQCVDFDERKELSFTIKQEHHNGLQEEKEERTAGNSTTGVRL